MKRFRSTLNNLTFFIITLISITSYSLAKDYSSNQNSSIAGSTHLAYKTKIQTKAQAAPLSPAFIYSMKKTDNGETPIITSTGHSLGLINSPIEHVSRLPKNYVKNISLPSHYDLRDEGILTSVKDQGICGACWAFATYGPIESKWLSKGYGTYDLSENNLNYGHGYEYAPCEGGNMYMSSAYLTRGDGPILEADDPYEVINGSYHTGLTPQGIITQARFLPNDDDNFVKQMIYEHGALYTSCHIKVLSNGTVSSDYLNDDFTYFYDGTELPNHAVTLVGWDDNKAVERAPGPGAWIIKNSFGSDWGLDGYFYISYYDSLINYDLAYWPEREEYDSNIVINQYDKLGLITGFGWPDDTDYGLVKFSIDKQQEIERIGTWIPASAYIRFELYENFDGSNLSDLIMSSDTISCDYAGYYSFELNESFPVNIGDNIYVKIEYCTPNYQYSIPIEMKIDNYSLPEISNNVFWISNNGDNATWVEMGEETYFKYDPCVKIYGRTPQCDLKCNFISNQRSGTAPQTIEFKDLSEGDPLTWAWNFGDGSSSMEQNPIHIYENTGTYHVSLTISDGISNRSQIKYSYINLNTSNFDTLLYDSFEDSLLTDWQIYDADEDSKRWVIVEESNWYDNAHSGIYGLRVWKNDTGKNNDWLISPSLTLADNSNYKFTFWAKSYFERYNESFNIKLSTTSNHYLDFTTLLDSIPLASYTWKKYSVDLSAYAGTTVYLAVQCVSPSGYALLLDDFICTPNNKPIITAIQNQSINEDSFLEFTLSAFDKDDEDLNYSVLSSSPEILPQIDANILTLTPETNWNGSSDITISCSDNFQSDTTKFTLSVNPVNDAPGEFNLLSPTDQSTIHDTLTELMWNPSYDCDKNDIVKYTVYYGKTIASINTIDVDTCTSLQLASTFLDNNTYYWKTVARDLNGVTRENTGGYHSFKVNYGNDTPSSPTPLTPDSVVVLNLSPQFIWNSSFDPDPDDSVFYKLILWNENSIDSVICDTNALTFQDSLEDNSEYSWEISAFDNHGSSSNSIETKFWINLFPEAPAIFSTLSPKNHEVLTESFVHLSWQKAHDPDPLDQVSYTLRYKSTHQDSSVWHEIETGLDTSLNLELALSNRYEWQVIASDELGFEIASDSSKIMSFDVGYISEISQNSIPEEFTLKQNFPNPFNPTTRLQYGLPETSNVKFIIFNVMGRKIKEWSIPNQTPGWYEIVWDGTDTQGNTISTGIYIYTLSANNYIETKKMIFMK